MEGFSMNRGEPSRYAGPNRAKQALKAKKRIQTSDALPLRKWIDTWLASEAYAITELYEHDGSSFGRTNVCVMGFVLPMTDIEMTDHLAKAIADLVRAGFLEQVNSPTPVFENGPAPTSNTGLKETFPLLAARERGFREGWSACEQSANKDE